MILFLMVLSVITLGLCLYLASKYRENDLAVLWCGLILVFVGVFSGLYMYIGNLPKKPEEIAFFTACFAVLASVGTNLLAASTSVGGAKVKYTSCCHCNCGHPAVNGPTNDPNIPSDSDVAGPK